MTTKETSESVRAPTVGVAEVKRELREELRRILGPSLPRFTVKLWAKGPCVRVFMEYSMQDRIGVYHHTGDTRVAPGTFVADDRLRAVISEGQCAAIIACLGRAAQHGVPFVDRV